MAEYYGIDLGTTYSCIAKINDDDIVEVISNPKGDSTTPSVVALDDKGKWIVGKAAKSKLGVDPDNVVAFIKREMPNPDYRCTLQGKTFTPEEISSHILKHLVDFANKKRVEEDGKESINDVVITVPAYFGAFECERTKKAGEMAGLNVLRLIHEPTAAALAYGRGSQRGDKIVLVYDLGGGTFDVSVLEFKNFIANVIAAKGDHHLGGVDWDRIIVDYALEEIGAKWDDLDKATQGMLMNAAEQTKQIISDPDETEAVLTFNYKGVQNVTIRREDFEARSRILLMRTKGYVEEALAQANMQAFDIDEVLLVGGSSRMPMVEELVTSLFPDSDVKIYNPDRAVATGAALVAMQTAEVETGQKTGIKGALSFGKDKGSRAYGVLVHDDNRTPHIANLIMVNDDLEITRTKTFSTLANGQTSVELHFFESESEYEEMDYDPSLEIPAMGGNQEVSWGKPVPRGTPVEMIAERDKSGIVKVYVSCSGSRGEFVLDFARKGQMAR